MTTATPPSPAGRQLLDELRTKVRAPIEKRVDEILDSFEDDNEGLAAFQLARADLDHLISKLEHEELVELARQLDAHGAELRAGITEMGQALAHAKSFAHAAEVFATVVGIVARIVALA
jgi:predicted  nucleic acid-binding Zn-ribbon protein